MNHIQQVGIMEGGNVLVALAPDFFQEMKKLLEYYKQNEALKRQQTEKQPVEFVSPKQFAQIIGVKDYTVREWCKNKLRPALADPDARRKKLDKHKALAIFSKKDISPPEPQPKLRPRYTQA